MVEPVKTKYPVAPQRLMSDRSVIESSPEIFSKLAIDLNKNLLALHQVIKDEKSMQAIKDILASLKEIGQAFLNSNEVIEDLSFHLDTNKNARTYESVSSALLVSFLSGGHKPKIGDIKTIVFEKNSTIPSRETKVAGHNFLFQLIGFQGIFAGFTQEDLAIISINPILEFKAITDPKMKFRIVFDSNDGELAFAESVEKLNASNVIDFGVRFIPPDESAPRSLDKLIWSAKANFNPLWN